MSQPVFEWYTDKAGNYRFNLKDATGEIIFRSKGYPTKKATVEAINNFKKSIPEARTKEITLKEVAKDVKVIKENQYRQEKQSNLSFILGVLLGGLIGVIGNFFVSYWVMNPQDINGLIISGISLIIMFFVLIILALKYYR